MGRLYYYKAVYALRQWGEVVEISVLCCGGRPKESRLWLGCAKVVEWSSWSTSVDEFKEGLGGSVHRGEVNGDRPGSAAVPAGCGRSIAELGRRQGHQIEGTDWWPATSCRIPVLCNLDKRDFERNWVHNSEACRLLVVTKPLNVPRTRIKISTWRQPVHIIRDQGKRKT